MRCHRSNPPAAPSGSLPVQQLAVRPTATNITPQYYYFGKNLQGDVIALYRSDYNSTSKTNTPTLVATYTYDPWGAPTCIYSASGATISQTASNVAAYNPFRYRGYRYDGDTRLYYLQSRYYDPAIGRFINADGYVSSGNGYMGYNMFAYCGNNPRNRIDPTGASWSDIKAAFKKFKSKVSHFISANFGLRYSTKVTTCNRQIPLIERILPLSVTVGAKRTRIVSETKDAKKRYLHT